MSESSKFSPEHPTILSLNKLWESNENDDIRIGALEKRMDKMEIKTIIRFERIENLLQQIVSDKIKRTILIIPS
ncbi:BgTH12-03773 [Blumeria graminis f. sp. triticale]|uniref:BgTH12-03773 n=1 Tax=Blumeria graminis f. sp. triticale TaxID=1689686 RepID=A0A9W4D1M3_BLUGR|nr:BgTH12-03773 [Blumeria graminis f. sp. triticale]